MAQEIYPKKEQGIETSKTPADEQDVYTEKGLEAQQENDEISPLEQAFMEGATGKGDLGKCARCGEMIDKDNTHEKEFKGKILFFCSEKCADAGPQH